ncbi:hypothetical protein [Bacteroides acidifaciens]|uniref:hypothetical protein n=1 Tax=Bacteroides acidifaciens TaxID=85831 RepID=UPI00248B7814|nr:hypothetical protein [Bacteroides acidifaciens]
MITRQVSALRDLAELQNISYHKSIINRAADTIEALSVKLAAANMERSEAYNNDGWIPCKDRLPQEKINPITGDFYEYQVTFQSEDVADVRHYKFGKGHWWNGPQIMDKYVTAWRAPILPYCKKTKLNLWR